MIRTPLPFFSGSSDLKDLLPALLRRRQTALAGQAVLDVPASNGDMSQLLRELGAHVTASDLHNKSLAVLTGGHLIVEYENRLETGEAVAELTGKLNLETART